MISANTTKISLSPIFQPTAAMDYLHGHVALPLSAVNNITGEQPRFFSSAQNTGGDSVGRYLNQHLKKVMNPTRVGANAMISMQLDHLAEINKPAVISDHLPVSFMVEVGRNTDAIPITSWNMLADIHRNNNYENITVDDVVSSLFSRKKLEYFSAQDALSRTWYFSDLATELARSESFSHPERRADFYSGTRLGQQVLIDFLQREYVEATHAVLRPSRQRTPAAQEQLRKKARAALVDEVIKVQKTDPHFASSDFYCAAVSTLKLFNSLNSGSMSWDSRKATLAKHTDLLQVLSQNQVILLQECTEPEWFVNTLNKQVSANSQSSFACISHKEAAINNNDHCAIIYDKSKWQIRNPRKDIVNFKLGRNKPAILARLTATEPRIGSDTLMVGSVHYPGNDDGQNYLTRVMDSVTKMAFQPNEPLFVAGDFNQSKNELDKKVSRLAADDSSPKSLNALDLSTLVVFEPQSCGGTMAGPDWQREHEGQIIDLAFSNTRVSGKVLDLKLFI
ncbi:endonuclease/exonuclease/phosphatase family protein [Yersinia ruckeri]|uniref:endonuclease/exonuclease/phosphatase family protein n=1 Tax=Yersinia ruckeri TaxID=29486 RepID=UPI0020BD8E40|nr:endonuclease/exonuclease/phosphatase family protein [Yersinia ruckeri]ELM3738724.1 hypothetical protein [Yersinia ruckeri]MCK8540978.1 hypothetical protein [Yersinia ruckeri]MCK8550882.1 hypothetical protein [Yersinia ruckeri]MCW6521287.1 hypothetical protein [Yersinia ruckeri]MCW6551371.1 hypothetical protein [Yersinia ruckeri]